MHWIRIVTMFSNTSHLINMLHKRRECLVNLGTWSATICVTSNGWTFGTQLQTDTTRQTFYSLVWSSLRLPQLMKWNRKRSLNNVWIYECQVKWTFRNSLHIYENQYWILYTVEILFMAFSYCALQGFQRASEKVKWIHDIYQSSEKCISCVYNDGAVLTFLLSAS